MAELAKITNEEIYSVLESIDRGMQEAVSLLKETLQIDEKSQALQKESLERQSREKAFNKLDQAAKKENISGESDKGVFKEGLGKATEGGIFSGGNLLKAGLIAAAAPFALSFLKGLLFGDTGLLNTAGDAISDYFSENGVSGLTSALGDFLNNDISGNILGTLVFGKKFLLFSLAQKAVTGYIEDQFGVDVPDWLEGPIGTALTVITSSIMLAAGRRALFSIGGAALAGSLKSGGKLLNRGSIAALTALGANSLAEKMAAKAAAESAAGAAASSNTAMRNVMRRAEQEAAEKAATRAAAAAAQTAAPGIKPVSVVDDAVRTPSASTAPRTPAPITSLSAAKTAPSIKTDIPGAPEVRWNPDAKRWQPTGSSPGRGFIPQATVADAIKRGAVTPLPRLSAADIPPGAIPTPKMSYTPDRLTTPDASVRPVTPSGTDVPARVTPAAPSAPTAPQIDRAPSPVTTTAPRYTPDRPVVTDSTPRPVTTPSPGTAPVRAGSPSAATGAAADSVAKAAINTSTIGESASRIVRRTALKTIPILGSLIGAGFALERLIVGDTTTASINAAGAALDLVPVVGTGMSIASDLASIPTEVFFETYKNADGEKETYNPDLPEHQAHMKVVMEQLENALKDIGVSEGSRVRIETRQPPAPSLQTNPASQGSAVRIETRQQPQTSQTNPASTGSRGSRRQSQNKDQNKSSYRNLQIDAQQEDAAFAVPINQGTATGLGGVTVSTEPTNPEWMGYGAPALAPSPAEVERLRKLQGLGESAMESSVAPAPVVVMGGDSMQKGGDVYNGGSTTIINNMIDPTTSLNHVP